MHRLNAVQAKNLKWSFWWVVLNKDNWKIEFKFLDNRDEFSSAPLWAVPAKVDRCDKVEEGYAWQSSLCISEGFDVDKVADYCWETSHVLQQKIASTLFKQIIAHLLYDYPLIINEIMWENVWKRKQIDDFFTSEP